MKKRMLSAFLALALGLGLAVPAFAASPLSTDFSQLVVNESVSTGYTFGEKPYTLGSTGADVSVLVVGSIRCGITMRTLETVKLELADLGVRNSEIYLLEVKDEITSNSVGQYVQKHPSYVHFAATSRGTYHNLFWEITYACDGRNGQRSATMPAVCVLDSACRPVYYASHDTFDQAAIHAALTPYAGRPFDDVPAGAYFDKAVNWAVSGGITEGASLTMFSPGKPCTHAEILTFLWRASGEPASSGDLPVDISGKNLAYAETALRWAEEKGLIFGEFDPLRPCTRAEAVEYIWLALGRPEAGSRSFSDIPYYMGYVQAVSWAVENGITDGVGGGKFAPDRVCSRGTIATFLYRAYVRGARLP